MLVECAARAMLPWSLRVCVWPRGPFDEFNELPVPVLSHRELQTGESCCERMPPSLPSRSKAVRTAHRHGAANRVLPVAVSPADPVCPSSAARQV